VAVASAVRREGASGEELLEFLDETTQVLDIAKMDSGRMVWRSEPVDLREVARDAAASVGGLFDGKTATLTVSLPETPAMVTGDRDKLFQVVVNLVSNARKFAAKQGGRVRLRLAEQGAGWLLSVADDGPGVPPDQRALVFDRFHQASTDGGNPTGTGLGLAITRMIVDHHGGRVWIDDAEGGGADFHVALPAAESAAAA
jgi:signal transduction histidine kinase